MSGKRRPIVLCVLDGLGMRDETRGNAFKLADTPTLDSLLADHPSTKLAASGLAVGLPEECVGNGEVGHMTLGAGRIVQTARARMDTTLEKAKFSFVPMMDQIVRICLYDECSVHLIGVVGGATAHSDMNHLYQLLDAFHFNEVPVVIHAILDGRDTAPRSAMTYLDRLEGYIEDRKAKIGTVIGRHFAMDRNERWNRTYKAFHAIVRDMQTGPTALHADTAYDAVAQARLQDLGDEFIEPTRIGDYTGFNGDYMCDFTSSATEQVWEWTGLDAGIAYNHRSDGIKQLVAMLARQDIPDYVADDLLMDRRYPVRAFREHCFGTITSHGDAIKVPIAFPTEAISSTLGEVLATHGIKQLRCAESEKRTHVTTYFSGGREEPFDGETRKIVKSPRLVDTYDEEPEMAAAKVTNAVLEALEREDVDFILVNFANPDMVTNLKSAKKALQAIDAAVGRIQSAVKEKKGTLLVTSDHGGCEQRLDDLGDTRSAHTGNPVPFIVVGEDLDLSLREGGSLCDVAPTVLDLMDIEKPEDMTGVSLRSAAD